MAIDINNIQDVDVISSSAPVNEPEPLTGKEKAGVYLTWGVIGVLVGFLMIILGIFLWGEHNFFSALENIQVLKSSDSSPEQLKKLEEMSSFIDGQQSSFRVFWFDTLQLILLNILFPTLTALLGYVFGTSRNNSQA